MSGGRSARTAEPAEAQVDLGEDVQRQQPQTLQAAGANVVSRVLDSGDELGQGPMEFVAGRKVAVLVGPDIMSDENAQGGMLQGYGLRAQRDRPDATLLDYKHLGAGSLHGFDSVVVIAHGAPGRTMWGAPKIENADGEKKLPGYVELTPDGLTAVLRSAGFRGTRVLLESCNGGTDTFVDRDGGSTGAALAAGLHADVLAARADDLWKAHVIDKDPIFELLQSGAPRLVTLDDVGSVVLDAGKTRVIGEVARTDVGSDLAAKYPSGYLVNDVTGTVLSSGSLASDLDEREEPMVTRVPHGHWVVYAPDGSRRVYTKH